MTSPDPFLPEVVLLDLAARTRSDALTALADRAAEILGCDPAAVLAALADREKLGSTGVGAGIALPHAGLPGLARSIALFARLARPVDWEAIDDRPVDLVAVVLSPSEAAGASLNLLARCARALRGGDVGPRLRRCADADAARRILAAAGE